MIRRALIAGLVVLLSQDAHATVDPFYLAVERDARAAALRGAAAEAARLYRVACFGMLDEPARLGGCSVRLALQQHAAGDREGFRETWNRLATVEQRFGGLSGSAAGDDERRDLALAARSWLDDELVRAIPVLAELQVAAAPSVDPGPGPARRARARAEAPPESAPPDDVEAAPVPEPEPERLTMEIGTDPASDVLTGEELALVAAARETLVGRPALEEVHAALDAVEALSERRPVDVDLARLTGRLAYRASLWERCAAAYRRAGDPGPDEPLERFYMAVCLYETGARDRAAEILHGSADRLTATPFVRGYVERILGGRDPGAP